MYTYIYIYNIYIYIYIRRDENTIEQFVCLSINHRFCSGCCLFSMCFPMDLGIPPDELNMSEPNPPKSSHLVCGLTSQVWTWLSTACRKSHAQVVDTYLSSPEGFQPFGLLSSRAPLQKRHKDRSQELREDTVSFQNVMFVFAA